MKSVLPLLLYLALFVSCIKSGEIESTRLLHDTSNNIIATAPSWGSTGCDTPLFILRNTTTNCLASVNSSGVITELGCPPRLQGATEIDCFAQQLDSLYNIYTVNCFVLNPVTKEVLVINDYGTITSSISLAMMDTPAKFSMRPGVQAGKYWADMFIYDSSNDTHIFNMTWGFTPTILNGTVIALRAPINAVPAPISGGDTVVGIYIFNNNPDFRITNFLVAKRGDFGLPYYDFFEGEFMEVDTFGGYFTSIGAAAKDVVGDFHVYDEATQSISVVDHITNEITKTVSLDYPVRFLATTRNEGLVVDAAGILTYEEAFSFSFAWENKTCDGDENPGSVTAYVSGGRFPHTFMSQPDGTRLVISAAGAGKILVRTDFQMARKSVLLDELYVSRAWYFVGSVSPPNRGWADRSEIEPFTGDYSYFFRVYPGTGPSGQANAGNFALQCTPGVKSSCMNASQHEYVEFALNVGNGGQKFQMALNTGWSQIIEPGDLPINQWKYYKIHIPTQLMNDNILNGFTLVQFVYLNGTTNRMYIDGFNLIPYETPFPARKLFIYDGCKKQMAAETIPFVYNPFTVEVLSKSVSCNYNTTISHELTINGALSVNITKGGEGPFTYDWFSGHNTSTVEGLGYFTSQITVYENELNSSWVDVSLSSNYSLYSTKYYRSYPYSIEFTPTVDREGLVFQVYPEIHYQDYPTIEFWVNGGDVGGQTMSVYLSLSTDVSVLGHVRNFDQDFFELLPNTWVKIRMTLPVQSSAQKYNIIGLVSVTPSVLLNQSTVQPTIYIDDIVLVGSRNTLTVKDRKNCKATTNLARVMTPPPLTQSVDVQHARCYNNLDGVVTITMGGGKAPYLYKWEGSSVNDSVLNEVGESFVYFTAFDAYGCQFMENNVTVLQPPVINIDVQVSPPKCYGGLGTASAFAVGGSGSYTYNWLGTSGVPKVLLQPAPEPLFTDAPAGTFQLNNAEIQCLGTGSHLHLEHIPTHSGYCTLSLFHWSTTASIQGCSLCMNPEKFNKIIFWVFSDSQQALAATVISLSSGSTRSTQVALQTVQPNLVANQWIKIEVEYNSFTGVARPDGVVFEQILTSTPLGRVLVDDLVIVPNKSNGAGFSALPGFSSTVEVRATEYYVTIVDGNGCSYYTTINVTEPEELNITSITTSPTSNDAKDATINVNVRGGNPPYTYYWLDLGFNTTTGNISNVGPGTYWLQVIDGNQCVREFQVFVERYSPGGVLKIKDYNTKLSSGLAALVGIGFLLALFSGAMLYRYWVSFSTLGSFLSSLILLGCVVSFLSALVLLPEPTDALCTSFIWLLGLGFVLVYGCLFIKTWALYKVWRNAVRYQKASLTPVYILKCLGAAVILEVIFLAIWTAIDPPKVHLMKTVDNTAEYQCNTKHITFWIIFLVVKGAWLIFGAVLSVLTRNIAKEYNESSSIAYAIYNNVLLGAIAIPLALLLEEVPGGRLVVIIVIICLAFSFTMVVVFFRIWHNILLPEKIVMNNSEMRSKRNTASSTGMSTGRSSGTSVDRSRDSKGSPTMSIKATESRDSGSTDAAV